MINPAVNINILRNKYFEKTFRVRNLAKLIANPFIFWIHPTCKIPLPGIYLIKSNGNR